MTDYLELTIDIGPFEPWADVLCHELGEMGFESFDLQNPKILAYIPADLFEKKAIEELFNLYLPEVELRYHYKIIPSKNWNEEWESNFHPVVVAEKVYIRAPFHPAKKEFRYEIVLLPKMSFGTGHHATTQMMMAEITALGFNNTKVLDAGCGTGILSILAEKCGAVEILAVDNDDWAVSNARENLILNNCHRTLVEKQEVNKVVGKSFNIILANINKNVILQDVGIYYDLLNQEGHLILSGFMANDVNAIFSALQIFGFTCVAQQCRDEWCMLHLLKRVQ